MEGDNLNLKVTKPTQRQPSPMGKKIDSGFKKKMTNAGVNVNSIKEEANFKDQKALKKQIFSLPKMETLVMSDDYLSGIYNKLKEEGQFKFGYHWNESIMNSMFNDYVLNDSGYLQKYKNTQTYNKKRRGEEGVEELEKELQTRVDDLKDKEGTKTPTRDKKMADINTSSKEKKEDKMEKVAENAIAEEMKNLTANLEQDEKEMNELFGFGNPAAPLTTHKASKNDTYFVDKKNNTAVGVISQNLTPQQNQETAQQFVDQTKYERMPWYVAVQKQVKGVPPQVTDGSIQDFQQDVQKYAGIPAIQEEGVDECNCADAKPVRNPNDPMASFSKLGEMNNNSVVLKAANELAKVSTNLNDMLMKLKTILTKYNITNDDDKQNIISKAAMLVKKKNEIPMGNVAENMDNVMETDGTSSGQFAAALDSEKTVADPIEDSTYDNDKIYQNETTTSASSGQFSGPAIWAKNPNSSRFAHKPAWKGGEILAESKDYLTNPDMFKKYVSLVEAVTTVEKVLNECEMSENNAKEDAINLLKRLDREITNQPEIGKLPEVQELIAHLTQVSQQPLPQRVKSAPQPVRGDSTNQWKQQPQPMPEHHLHTKQDRIDFILQHTYDDASDSAKYSLDQLNGMSDADVEKLYLDTEHKMGMNELFGLGNKPEAQPIGSEKPMQNKFATNVAGYKNLVINALRHIPSGDKIIGALDKVYDQYLVKLMGQGLSPEQTAQAIQKSYMGLAESYSKNFVNAMKTDLKDTRDGGQNVNGMSAKELEDKENLFKGGAINEKAESKSQQRFMGMVHAAQKGELKNPSAKVAKAAAEMSDKDAEDFASTKHKGLPNHVKKHKKEKVEENMVNPQGGENIFTKIAELIFPDNGKSPEENGALGQKFYNDFMKNVSPEKAYQMLYDKFKEKHLAESGSAFNEEAYKQFFRNKLKSSGKSLKNMSPEEKKNFFGMVDREFQNEGGNMHKWSASPSADNDESKLTSFEYFVESYHNGNFSQAKKMLQDIKAAGQVRELRLYLDEMGQDEVKDWAFDNLSENWHVKDAVHPSKKGMFKGKTQAELHKELTSAKERGDTTKQKEINFALRAKHNWGKVQEESMLDDKPDSMARTMDSDELNTSGKPMGGGSSAPVAENDVETDDVQTQDQNQGDRQDKEAIADAAKFREFLMSKYGVNSVAELSPAQKRQVMKDIEANKKPEVSAEPTTDMKGLDLKNFAATDAQKAAFKSRDNKQLGYLAQHDNEVNSLQDYLALEKAYGEEHGERMFHPMAILASIESLPDEEKVQYSHIENVLRGQLNRTPQKMEESKEKWEQGAVEHPGALHKKLGIPSDQKIPMETINNEIAKLDKKYGKDEEMSADDRHFKKMLTLAKTFKKQESMNEERKTPSMLNLDKVHKETVALTQKDMANADALKQAKVYPNPDEFYIEQDKDKIQEFKTGQELEAEALKKMEEKKALENVGNSTNENGKEIPKRNLTKEEKLKLAMDRGDGMHNIVYDNKPSDKFEKRLEKDMGEDQYKLRQEKMKYREPMPQYNKDTQPTESGEKKEQNDKFKVGYNEAYTGKYTDGFGVTRLVEFQLENTEEVASINEGYKLTIEGLGNKYNNRVTESVLFPHVTKFDFYLIENKVVRVKSENKSSLNEAMNDKMKHLMNYDSRDFVNSKKSVKF